MPYGADGVKSAEVPTNVKEVLARFERTREVYADSIVIRMRPERWLTADYAKETL